MKLSWSHKLFFQTNRLVGKSAGFDALVKFFAKYALPILAVLVIWFLWWRYPQAPSLVLIFIWLPLLWLIGFGLSALIGLVYPHRRPNVEFPEIRRLITPLSDWKSLPSDHAFSAWLLVFAAWLTPNGGNLTTWPIIFFALWATLICLARVLAGVHYPRDIIAGTALAWVVALAFFR